MNVLRHTDRDFAEQLRRVTGASELFDKGVEERARAILEAVYTRGDAALLELTERFDGAKLTIDQMAVTQAELMAASLKADETLREAIEMAREIRPDVVVMDISMPEMSGIEATSILRRDLPEQQAQ